MPTTSQPDSATARLSEVLQKYWGYDSFLPLQEPAMTCVLNRRDSLVVLPTGGGKSLCFQVPAMTLDGLAVVVSPLISLMKDQVDSLVSNGVPAACIHSMVSLSEKRKIADQVQAGELKLLYVAPERLVQEKTIEFLKAQEISLVAIDEAHCISAWGHDFRPEYRQLRIMKEVFPAASVHAYTATATPQVRDDIVVQLGLDEPEIHVGSFDRPNLIYKVQRRNNRLKQIREVLDRYQGQSGIVYCITRKDVDETSSVLSELGYKALPYHAGMDDTERQRNQDAFIQEKVDTIVATVAFGMGIDKSNVRYVIHAGMPKSLEHYQQESGRSGRDGLEAECHLFHSGQDFIQWRNIIENSESSSDTREGMFRALSGISNFCSGVTCRHRALVEYFGQTYTGNNCGACDVCVGELDLVEDPIVIGQKILSCVVRLQQRFGAGHTAEVLTGSENERIMQRKHNKLSTWGILSDEPKRAVRDWIEQLVEQGFAKKVGEFNTLEVTEKGWQLLKGVGDVRLLKPSKPNKERPRAAVEADSWDGVDRGLFDHLRQLRRAVAEAQGVPAYIVFGDAALRDMARRRPSTLDQFRQVRGVGEKKLNDYGDQFITAISEYCSERDITMDVIPPTPKAIQPLPKSSSTGPSAAAIRAFPLFRKGDSIENICRQLNRASSTVEGYLVEYIRHEKIADPKAWVSPGVIERVTKAAGQFGTERLKPIYDALGGSVSYDEIRVVVECVKIQLEAQ